MLPASGSDHRPVVARCIADSTAPVIGGYRTVSGVRIPIPKGRAGIAINFALNQVGDRYVWVADGPDVWDCSGFTARIPAQSDAQNRGIRHVPVSQAQPGDTLWHPGHVQIFLGVIGGKWTAIEAANPRAGIRVDQTHWMRPTTVLRP